MRQKQNGILKGLQRFFTLRTILEIVIALALIITIIVLAVNLAGVPVKEVKNSEYEIGIINDEGRAEEDMTAIYTKEYFTVVGLNCTLDEKADIVYQLYFYDDEKGFISASEELKGDFNGVAQGMPEGAAYVRIMITPTSDKDGIVAKGEINKYAKQLTVIVSKEN